MKVPTMPTRWRQVSFTNAKMANWRSWRAQRDLPSTQPRMSAIGAMQHVKRGAPFHIEWTPTSIRNASMENSSQDPALQVYITTPLRWCVHGQKHVLSAPIIHILKTVVASFIAHTQARWRWSVLLGCISMLQYPIVIGQIMLNAIPNKGIGQHISVQFDNHKNPSFWKLQTNV